ncbi:hypothetical protein SAMN05660206_10618 [Sphingobacterium wenxiniae]|uniref:Uncharacterized protein n=1 Tax=Sphingobacterium wenxiniae TaxID=683125 RepID=A0A1I6T9L1_9SPHI|nr:hypothetical protein SAMN05660206_10618 [Sphingobacterium wenxiniae]
MDVLFNQCFVAQAPESIRDTARLAHTFVLPKVCKSVSLKSFDQMDSAKSIFLHGQNV